MNEEHGVTLLQTDMQEICNIVKEQQITSFVEWLKDNHSIEIHDMIVQDYVKYGG
jgi:hypothetical protein